MKNNLNNIFLNAAEQVTALKQSQKTGEYYSKLLTSTLMTYPLYITLQMIKHPILPLLFIMENSKHPHRKRIVSFQLLKSVWTGVMSMINY